MDAENRRRSLRWEKFAAVFAVICILTADRGISAPDGRGKPVGERLGIFDGKSKVIIVNGYCPFFRWLGWISGKNQSVVGNFHICSGHRPAYSKLRVDMNLGSRFAGTMAFGPLIAALNRLLVPALGRPSYN